MFYPDKSGEAALEIDVPYLKAALAAMTQERDDTVRRNATDTYDPLDCWECFTETEPAINEHPLPRSVIRRATRKVLSSSWNDEVDVCDLHAFVAEATGDIVPPVEMTPEDAIDIVAQHAIAAMVEDGDEDLWEDYPEVGEADWLAICDKMNELAPYPNPERYEAAYSLLEARAEHTDEELPPEQESELLRGKSFGSD